MKKTHDWFLAGLVAGTIGGIAHLLWNTGILLLGVQHKTFWQAMGGLFYSKQLLPTVLAQIHGAIDAIGVSSVNGVILSYVLKVTGKDYLHLKSITLSSLAAYFLFVVVFPQTGLGKSSTVVPWVAMGGFTLFNGLLAGYVLRNIYSFDDEPETPADREYP